MKIEIGGSEELADVAGATEKAPAIQAGDAVSVNDNEPTKGKSLILQQLKAQASEEDEPAAGTQTLRQIVGGDYLLTMVRHHIGLIVLVVVLTCFYIGVRYQCQEDVITISNKEKELIDARYKAMASSSTLTEMCRQSNVLRVLRANEDTLLQISNQPPFIITISEE